MKMIRKFALLAVCALALGAVAQQNPPSQGGSGDQGRPRRMPTVDEQMKDMTEKLSLTSDQQSKIRPIVEDAHNQTMKIMQDDSMSREDKRAKLRTIHETSSAKARELLNDDQKKKFDEMMQERMRQRQQNNSGENHPK